MSAMNPRHEGFTLIELLVVLVLVGIMVSMVVLSVGGQREKQLRNEIIRLQQVIRLAHEEAILNRNELAIRFRPNAYEFETLEDEEWQSISSPDFMRYREIDEDFSLSLLQDGIPIPLQGEEGGRVLLASSGEMTPFELELRLVDSDAHYRLTGSAFGELNIEGVDDVPTEAREG
jgi:general secretion pathway protein H